jgi:hypothetical protein
MKTYRAIRLTRSNYFDGHYNVELSPPMSRKQAEKLSKAARYGGGVTGINPDTIEGRRKIAKRYGAIDFLAVSY